MITLELAAGWSQKFNNIQLYCEVVIVRKSTVVQHICPTMESSEHMHRLHTEIKSKCKGVLMMPVVFYPFVCWELPWNESMFNSFLVLHLQRSVSLYYNGLVYLISWDTDRLSTAFHLFQATKCFQKFFACVTYLWLIVILPGNYAKHCTETSMSIAFFLDIVNWVFPTNCPRTKTILSRNATFTITQSQVIPGLISTMAFYLNWCWSLASVIWSSSHHQISFLEHLVYFGFGTVQRLPLPVCFYQETNLHDALFNSTGTEPDWLKHGNCIVCQGWCLE